MKRMIIAIRGEVDDDTEAQNILTAVETSLKPFEELDLKVDCDTTSRIETPG